MTFKVGKYTLDEQQSLVVTDTTPHLLVVAGAGSGKTLTILGKISYLINNLNIAKEEIICISFTKASSLSLKEKIQKEFNIDMNVYTFHKLALLVLEKYQYDIASDDLLSHIVYKFFHEDILTNTRLLKKLFKYFNLNNMKDYHRFLKSKEYLVFQNLIITFIHLFKCNNYTLDSFLKFKKDIMTIFNFHYFKEKTLLLIFLNIYLAYQNYLKENNEIDFDDMLILATKEVLENGFPKPLKYLIIDEYQDTSLVRFNFIKEILSKTNANLMVVGDDFQSIYRFTGCDLSIFLDFNKYFVDSKILKIENTYRNSKELISVAGSFVMKNPYQLSKELNSSKHLSLPIEVVYYQDNTHLSDLLIKIYNETKASIMVLGRNNKDINIYLNANLKLENDKLIIPKMKDIDITYLTVHKSKGLECDNVILINLTDTYLGFPSKQKNANILRLVSLNKNIYPYDEERRLFYVALTRTKNKVYLFVKKDNLSIFVKELLKDYPDKINISSI